MKLPSGYIISKFYQYVGFPTFKKISNTYNGCCPSCREGKSWGKKKRLYYIVKNDYFYCQNCCKSWSTANWIMEQTGLSYKELIEDVKKSDYNINIVEEPIKPKKNTSVGTLPEDSINLFDKQQLEFYKNNQIIKDVLEFIKMRRLDTAINKPKNLFISLKDFVHKNRLCIPFYDINNKIKFYQTRTIYNNSEGPKYLSKLNSEKTVYGINNINTELEYLFITEGPIDASFIKNGLAVGGISLTELQKKELEPYYLYNKVWILDNQLDNKNVKNKMEELIQNNETVFIWPSELKQFKDINEVCQKFELDSISTNFILKNSFKGLEALVKI